MVGFGDPPNHAALVRTVLAGDPVGLRTGCEDREAVGTRRGLVQEVGPDVLGLPRHRPADPLGRGGRAPDPMAGRFSDLAVASTNHRKTEASSAASGGAYVLRRLTPSQTAKVQLRLTGSDGESLYPRPCRTQRRQSSSTSFSVVSHGVTGTQPSIWWARVASPATYSKSVGRSRAGSTSTCGRAVERDSSPSRMSPIRRDAPEARLSTRPGSEAAASPAGPRSAAA